MKRHVLLAAALVAATTVVAVLTAALLGREGRAAPGETTTTVPTEDCKAELYLTSVEVLKDTDVNAVDTWRFEIDARKRQVTGNFNGSFDADKGKEGYDVSVFEPQSKVVGLKGDNVPIRIEIKVTELDGRLFRGRGPNDAGTGKTRDGLSLRCPAARAAKVVEPLTVEVTVPPNPAGGLAGVETEGRLKFSFVCVLDP